MAEPTCYLGGSTGPRTSYYCSWAALAAMHTASFFLSLPACYVLRHAIALAVASVLA